MPRYKILIEYDGTNYSGWQIQPNANTVEEELEKALSRILQEDIDVIGQGRTDSGVHAEAQVAHVDIDRQIDIDQLLYALLGVLPRDICVWEMEEASQDFHARFDGKSRRYRYQIVTRPSALNFRTVNYIHYSLNFEAMQECAKMVKGTHDFENFRKANKDQPDAICTVQESEFCKKNYLITYRIKANRFVHHMVRRLVGTMIQVGSGKRSVEDFDRMLHQPEIEKISHGASAKGLILEKVGY